MNENISDAGRKPNGTFATGNDIGAAGKPKGCKNKATRAMEQLLDDEGHNITRKAIELAMAGDQAALRLCMERLLAPCKDRHVTLDLPPMTCTESIAQASATIIEAVSQGELTPTEANRVMQLVEVSRRTIEAEQLEKRIERLEQGRG